MASSILRGLVTNDASTVKKKNGIERLRNGNQRRPRQREHQQTKGLNELNNSTCVINHCAFLCRILQNKNLKWPSSA